MEDISFLSEFLMILIPAALVAYSFERFRLPSILGYLLVGICIGPHGFRLIEDLERVRQMAGVGLVLLMLTIGLELSFDRMKGLGRIGIVGGAIQIVVSAALGIFFAKAQGWDLRIGGFLGAMIALSSTAIVLKFLMDRGELDSQYGRVALAILLFQDFAVVLLMIPATGMLDLEKHALGTVGLALLKSLLFVTMVVLLAKAVLPAFLRRVAMTRNREIFFLMSVVVCLGMAWLSGELGLSFAIGAFFAGVMFANTEFGDHFIGEVIPFRHVFVSIFFVSIGLLFDVRFTLAHFPDILKALALVILVNFVLMTGVIHGMGFPLRMAMATGLILSQVGEFAFILLETAKDSGVLNAYFYNLLLSVTFISMLLTPLLFQLVGPILRFFEAPHLLEAVELQRKKSGRESPVYRGHVILCGFGPSGKDLAETFREEKIPFVLIEMNPQKVKAARQAAIDVIYGDAANIAVLERAGIARARAMVVSFGDASGNGQIIRVVQRLNSDVMIGVRTRYERDVPRLYEIGADIVVMEEWQASYELNRHILNAFRVPPERIQLHLDRIRARIELVIENAILNKNLRMERTAESLRPKS
ncbi:MAG: cation:proton antiporter [Candidatus Omnitrophota bacterium]